MIFDVEDGEHYLSLTARDQAGTDVELSVKFDTDGDGDTEGEWRWVCTSTERALQLPEGTVTVVVEVHRGSCEDGTSSQPTTGTIRAEFS